MARRKVVHWFDVEEATQTSRLFDQQAENARVRLASGRLPRDNRRYYIVQLVAVVVFAAMLLLIAMKL